LVIKIKELESAQLYHS